MKILRTLAPAVLVLAFAAAAIAAPPSLELGNFHAKMTMSTSAGGKDMSMDGEYWMHGKKMKMSMSGPAGAMTTIVDEKFAWTWMAGQKQGMKMPLTPENSSNSLLHANDCLASAKSLGKEKVDGVDCEKWQYTDCNGQKDVTTTYWIVSGKKIPKKVETKTKQGMSTILFKEFDTNAKVADAMFTPPSDVAFQDMSEMMKQMQQKGGHPPASGGPKPEGKK